MLQLFSHYESGHMPAAGGITDQPHKIMQAFLIISDRRAQNMKKRNGKKTPR
jgi:hypothetical protein